MPIVDVELICDSEADFRSVSAAAVAEAVGQTLGCGSGRAWIRLRHLASGCYAENGVAPSKAQLPVFVTVLHSQLPVDDALRREALALTQAIAEAVERRPELVHVEYAQAAAGRQAFGGVLVNADT